MPFPVLSIFNSLIFFGLNSLYRRRRRLCRCGDDDDDDAAAAAVAAVNDNS